MAGSIRRWPTGIYEKHGLEVTIRPGGPQVNHAQLLAAGKIDFNMGGNVFEAFNYVQNDIPMVVVAAIFQKDPQILMAHPDQGFETPGRPQGPPDPDLAGRAHDLLGVAQGRSTATATTRSAPTPSTPRRSSPTRPRSSRAI